MLITYAPLGSVAKAFASRMPRVSRVSGRTFTRMSVRARNLASPSAPLNVVAPYALERFSTGQLLTGKYGLGAVS